MTLRHAVLPLALMLACGSTSALAARGFEVRDLATLPSREQLAARLAGNVVGKMTEFAGLLQATQRKFAGLIEARAKQLEGAA